MQLLTTRAGAGVRGGGGRGWGWGGAECWRECSCFGSEKEQRGNAAPAPVHASGENVDCVNGDLREV